MDPAGFVDGINRYVYALNSPINYTDPTGLTIASPLANPENGSYCFGSDALETVTVTASPLVDWTDYGSYVSDSWSSAGSAVGDAWDVFTDWAYENLSLEMGFDLGVGPGVAGELNLNFNEITAEGVFGAVIWGTDSHVGANIQLTGPGLETGFYGLTEVCGFAGVGGCLEVNRQGGHSNWELFIGTVLGSRSLMQWATSSSYWVPLPSPKIRIVAQQATFSRLARR